MKIFTQNNLTCQQRQKHFKQEDVKQNRQKHAKREEQRINCEKNNNTKKLRQK